MRNAIASIKKLQAPSGTASKKGLFPHMKPGANRGVPLLHMQFSVLFISL